MVRMDGNKTFRKTSYLPGGLPILWSQPYLRLRQQGSLGWNIVGIVFVRSQIPLALSHKREGYYDCKFAMNLVVEVEEEWRSNPHEKIK